MLARIHVVRGLQQSADNRMHAEHREVVAGDELAGHLPGLGPTTDDEGPPGITATPESMRDSSRISSMAGQEKLSQRGALSYERAI